MMIHLVHPDLHWLKVVMRWKCIYVNLLFFLFRANSNESETESEFVNSVFTLLKNILTSNVTIISENVPKTLGMLDRSEFLFVIEREKMIRYVFSDWDSVMSLVFDFQIDRTDSNMLLLGIEMV